MYLDILETAYDFGLSNEEWQHRIVDSYARDFDGEGRVGFLYELGADGSLGLPCGYETPDAVDRTKVFDVLGGLAQAAADPKTVVSLFDSVQASTLSTRLAELGDERLLEFFASFGVYDAASVCSGNASRAGFLFADLMTERAVDERVDGTWLKVAAHVASISRLRLTLLETQIEDAEFVVDSQSGDVVHARGPAITNEKRKRLRSAFDIFDHARTRAARDEPLETLDRWRALVDGRWSIIDRFDTDGRRFILALPNPPDVRATRSLSAAQADVVEYLLQGHTQKFIAYELGLTQSAVSRRLSAARRRLGASSNAELVSMVTQLLRGERIETEIEGVGLELITSEATSVEASLSVAEQELVACLRRGYDDCRIARERGTSVKTVQNQLYRLYDRLGVHSREELLGALS